MSFNFSQSFRCSSSPSPSFSHDGKFIACAQEHYRLSIRDARSHDLLQLYSCLDRIDAIEWSPNSQQVLTMIKARGIIQVWSATDDNWACKIDEGPAGVQSATWSPDGLSILILAAHGIRTTAWSLMDQRCTHLPPCKTLRLQQGVSFCPLHCGSYMAQLERTAEAKDRVNIYDTSSWSKVVELSASTTASSSSSSVSSKTFDAVKISWSPNGCYIIVVDDSLQFKLLIFDAAAAILSSSSSSSSSSCKVQSGLKDISHFPPASPISITSSHSAPPVLPIFVYTLDGALGIKTTEWDPSGEFLAIGSFDNRLRVLSSINWQPILDVDHPFTIQGPPGGTAIYKETEQEASSSKTMYKIVEPPFSLRQPAPPPPYTKLGVNMLQWDSEGRFIATVSGSSPMAVWIWDVANGGRLASICHHEAPVKAMEWQPRHEKKTQSMLAIVTEGARSDGSSAKAYLWTPRGALIVNDVPMDRGFLMESLIWSPTAESFALIAKDNCCIAHLSSIH